MDASTAFDQGRPDPGRSVWYSLEVGNSNRLARVYERCDKASLVEALAAVMRALRCFYGESHCGPDVDRQPRQRITP